MLPILIIKRKLSNFFFFFLNPSRVPAFFLSLPLFQPFVFRIHFFFNLNCTHKFVFQVNGHCNLELQLYKSCFHGEIEFVKT
jgi:hypothetical protein